MNGLSTDELASLNDILEMTGWILAADGRATRQPPHRAAHQV